MIIYPLNALVNDQLKEWEQILRAHPKITFARFTGQTPNNQEDFEKSLKMQIHQESLEKHPQITQAERQQWEKKELDRHLIAYGHEFHSFCLIVRPLKQPESVESLMYALQKGLCQVLELDNSDIGVSRRWLNKRTAENAGIEIILYDRTPGGAGFVEEGKNRWDEVVAAACSLCETSPTHQCEAACYDCLKDFGNQQHHDALDRNTVLRFFK